MKDTIIVGSKELFIIGITLNRTMITFYSQLEQKLKDGQKIRILVVEPNSEATQLIPQRIYRPTSDQRLSNKILESLTLICSLRSLAPDRLEVRTINFPIPFGCFVSDIESSDGSIYLEYYSYKTTKDLPCVVVSARTDPSWYSVYKTEILNLWNAGHEWNCKP